MFGILAPGGTFLAVLLVLILVQEILIGGLGKSHT
jgi:hypothetical protein